METDKPEPEPEPLSITSALKAVQLFHEKYNVPVRTTPTINIPEQEKTLRYELLYEEVGEFGDAIEFNDLVEVADALMDILYVTYGACLAFGIPVSACFEEVQRSNMSKLGEDGRPVYDVETGKVLKGPNYSPPDLAPILKTHGWDQKEK